MTDKPCSYCGTVHVNVNNDVICDYEKIELPKSKIPGPVRNGRDLAFLEDELRMANNDLIILNTNLQDERKENRMLKSELELCEKEKKSMQAELRELKQRLREQQNSVSN